MKSRRINNIFINKFSLLVIIILMGLFLYSSVIVNSMPVKYRLNNNTYKLITAKNTEEWQKGLMYFKNRDELKGANGMLFIFPTKEYRSFWNKNTHLDLDVYWIDNNKIVGKSFLPAIENSQELVVVKSPMKVDKVIEIIK